MQKSLCEDGQVNLTGGANVREGRVEVCLNRVWGTVCSEQFSDDDAQVVCSQMNFERNSKPVKCNIHMLRAIVLFGV